MRHRPAARSEVKRGAARRFVVVSGLPGSGKSWLAWRLAPLLALERIDKDDILERLFDRKGAGDASWRRTLSRESDLILRAEAEAGAGAMLVSFWRVPGMAADSGTPADWLAALAGQIVQLHCDCPAEIAAQRFIQRNRHAGHLDRARSPEQILASIRELERLPLLEVGERITVLTATEVDGEAVAARIDEAFGRLSGNATARLPEAK